ncbi:MAG: hypothetical protein HOQ28_15990 [Thermoleophilia bacterium]|nr:hypothetical protein [Thermoleophilia bacterium]
MRALSAGLLLLVVLALAGCGGAKNAQPKAQHKAPGKAQHTVPHKVPHKVQHKAQEPKLLVGAVEDAAKYARDPVAQMKLARESGFRAIVLSAVWEHGASAAADLPRLRRAVDAATKEDIRPVLAVYELSGDTPADGPTRAAFVAYAAALAKALPDVRDVIVGNEPNLNLFWQPQFDAAGGDQAAVDYEQLLAAAYDRLKEQDPGLDVIGGGLASHGGDKPSSRPTHSPTQFIHDLGAAYRASGRTKPLMDAISVHVYGEANRIPPTLRHPLSTTLGIADYPKLVRLLTEAFGGTAQPGATLPIVYGEYGVETKIPPAKEPLYTGREVVAPVDEQTQALYYGEAIRAAERQPNVRMLFLFHVVDETRLEGLQSGTRYADGTPKTSEPAVRAALDRASSTTPGG